LYFLESLLDYSVLIIFGLEEFSFMMLQNFTSFCDTFKSPPKKNLTNFSLIVIYFLLLKPNTSAENVLLRKTGCKNTHLEFLSRRKYFFATTGCTKPLLHEGKLFQTSSNLPDYKNVFIISDVRCVFKTLMNTSKSVGYLLPSEPKYSDHMSKYSSQIILTI